MQKECPNCAQVGPLSLFLGRWCIDCWRAALKGGASAIGAALVSYVLARLLG